MLEKVKAKANDGISSFVYAGILAAQNRVDQAAEQYTLCINTAKENDIRIAAYKELVSLYGKNGSDIGMLDKEIAVLQDMRRTYPNDEQAFVLEQLGEAYYTKSGIVSEESGDETDNKADLLRKESISCFNELISLGYGRASTYLNIAIVSQRRADYEGAEKLLAQAIQLFPDEKELYSKQSEIAAKKSIDLIDACAPNAGKGCTVYKSGSSFKMGTQSYSPGFVINNQNVDLQSGEEAYAQVTFDQKYSSLSMLVGRTGNSQQGTFSVHIYLDNKLVRQYEIDDDSVKTVTLDVSGAETMRVVVISQTSGIECGFAEAALKK